MNKRLKTLSCALVAIFALTVAVDSPKLGPFGVDAVSAATGAAPVTPAKPSTPTKNSTPSKSYSQSNYTSSSSASSSSTSTLKIGSNGSEVKLLQTNLNKNGYKLIVDGFFGKLTSDAVKNYQWKHGITFDGIAGPATLEKLTPKPAPVARILSTNCTGTDVKMLQTSLNKNGYKLIADGFFGKLTSDAVKNYQWKHGLKIDGIAGPATCAKLNAKPPVVKPPVVKPPVVKPPVVVTPPDVVTSASIVDNATDFEKAISKDGKWIIATLNDVTTTKDLVLEGKLLNGKKDAAGVDLVQRKIALYAQDDKHVVTERFTLTAPKLTVLSPEAVIQGGTFKGDVYVNSRNFKLTDATIVGDVYVHSTEFALSKNAKIEGNVYFDNIEAQKTIKIEAGSSVTGTQGYKSTTAVDSVTSASLVNDEAAFENAISPAGTWIIAIQRDMVINKDLVLEGTKSNTKVPPVVSRKIALYYHDDDNYTTARFTLKAPKLTIKSPMATIQKGIFIGDLYVESDKFNLKETRIEGNVIFATQAIKDTFTMDALSSITGTQTVAK